MKTKSYAETDMYEPIRELLAAQGFDVRGEVKGCDIAAVKEDKVWVVEMKLNFNVTLLYQAMERLKITENVFVAIPRPRRGNDKRYRMMRKILHKLELGLIIVSLDSPVRLAEVILFPGGKKVINNKTTVKVRREVAGRIADTAGGISKQKVNTAYRERCVRVACLMARHGPLSAAALVGKYGCEKDAYRLIRANVYGWFFKKEKGLYHLTQIGIDYLLENENSSVVAYYKMKAAELL